ncbi:MAG: 4-hydroxythreonine-4-phosphate dehydrogenase PdxA [Betaproteobacteria bacterium]
MTVSRPNTIAITSGEPAGIGPDLCVITAAGLAADRESRYTILADADLLAARADALRVSWPIIADNLHIEHVPLATAVGTGVLNASNSRYVLSLIDHAVDGCMSGEYAAMVTAPVHKGIINDAGIRFSGHTEYLADRTNTPQVVMMLVGRQAPVLRVALATIHLALKDVPAAITQTSLERTVRILHADLKKRFGIKQPHIVVAGLNPHAGEGGYLGREEIEVILPVLEKLRAEGMYLDGPLPADTLFTPRHLNDADAVLTMYHDQGLPVLKYATFGEGVNVTLGLPIIRTSVDHGTALDLAGTGKIETGSMLAAIELAAQLSRHR